MLKACKGSQKTGLKDMMRFHIGPFLCGLKTVLAFTCHERMSPASRIFRSKVHGDFADLIDQLVPPPHTR